ncbi:MAG: fumarylacetoacetate hydrolase family protein [Phycisphaerales bacterium]|nr:fumarylacetoacetate hydrolase family protein [Phycisphaerales bacterium]
MYKLIKIDCGVGVEVDGSVLPIRQIIGIGRNYAAHAIEQGADVPEHPMVFMKNINAAGLDGDEIVIPPIARDANFGGNQTDYEAELAVILGRDALDVSEDEALEYVLGYCCANDVSARWWQKKGSGGQFNRGKSFDTFCPLGPAVVPASEIEDVQDLGIVCRVNGVVMQDASTDQMMFSVAKLISMLSSGTTLAAGTVILTGTPSGVGMAREPQVWLQDGDVVKVEIEGVGTLTNRVRFG